ncbi:MAG: FHA domain-containing protein [Gammaproteobacteria bacterium]|nr:FHA domain-containing protein [Gammaproteobacteria bacterium]
MDLRAAGLSEQPFPPHGAPCAVVDYRSQKEALEVLHETIAHPNGACFLQGPDLSGKSILVHRFIESLGTDVAIAAVNGKGLSARKMLLALLEGFGFDVDLKSSKELLALVRVYTMQQAASHSAPVLIVERTQDLHPSALRVLCELAALRVPGASALKMVLIGDQPLAPIFNAPAMESIAARVRHDFHLHPMTRDETRAYLHEKLLAAGADYPAFVFPTQVCDTLHDASGGWPGVLDRVALLALARTDTLPVPAEVVERPALPTGTWAESGAEPKQYAAPPHLIVSNHGSVMQELDMEQPRLLVGRSSQNDIAIGSRFVSRHHALLVRHRDVTFILDLGSTNGTFVNGTQVSNHLLHHDDVITIGHHRIKFYDPHTITRRPSGEVDLADTVVMKTLDDTRNMLAKKNATLRPATSEDLPTLQT